jgi:hypothetical protein
MSVACRIIQKNNVIYHTNITLSGLTIFYTIHKFNIKLAY